jgi:hypothetical protein
MQIAIKQTQILQRYKHRMLLSKQSYKQQTNNNKPCPYNNNSH